MREIKFRGQRVDNKEWVYGGYHKHIARQICPIGEDKLSGSDIKHLIIQSGFADWDMPKPLEAVEVIPETVGQFTGLKDIHKKRVFDGDYVKVLRDDSFKPYVAQVYFASGCFGTTWYNPIEKKNMFVHLYKFEIEITEEE